MVSLIPALTRWARIYRPSGAKELALEPMEKVCRRVIRPQSLELVVMCALLSFCTFGCSGDGTVSGTVAYVDNGQFPGGVRDSAVVVKSGDQELTLKANDEGDFIVTLQAGQYSLVRVLDGDGRQLVLDATQARSFSVHADRNARFDVIVRPLRESP